MDKLKKPMLEQPRRKIFLAVSGMSPQIITETLYALMQEKQWVPDEVHLITTLDGCNNAVLQLLEGERHFPALLQDYGVSTPIDFSMDNIHIIQGADGAPLADLRTPADNEAAADTISGVIRELASDADTELHVSLAGGRKTMGFYAGYALSLFGRSQDCLSHVLVSAEYEGLHQFFYPAPETRVVRDRNGKPLDASQAKVWLAEIPFVRLRSRLPEALLKGTHSFSETVRLAREATENVTLMLYPKRNAYSVNGRDGTLSSLHMALLLWVANTAPVEPLVVGENREAAELLGIAEEYWLNLDARTEGILGSGITKEWLEPNISRLNKALAKALGQEMATRCKLASRTVNGKRGYALPEDLTLKIEME